MDNELKEQNSNIILNKISNEEKEELVTNHHPWLGHPNFLFTKNVEDTVRIFYQGLETDIMWAAIRALLLDDETNFNVLKQKYKELEKKILEEIQWAKDNPNKIKEPGKVEYQEMKVSNGNNPRLKPSPFYSAVLDKLHIMNIEKHAKVKEVYIPEEKQKRIDILSNLPHKQYDNLQVENTHYQDFLALESDNPKLIE